NCHHTPSSTFRKVVSQLNPYYLFGLTATPNRRDKLEKLMFQVIGDIFSKISMKKVEKHGGVMMPKILYRTLDSKVIESNQIQTILKNNIINNEDRNLVIVQDIVREAMLGNYCIVVSDRKVHCEKLVELISAAWAKTGIATGDYNKKYVEEQVKRFEDGEITVLVTTFALLGEGFDIAFLNRAFVAMPFRAENKVVQLIGRIQRTAEGKKDAVVYDYVDHNIGVLRNQFYAGEGKPCRYNAYAKLGLKIEPL
ncbi:MAG: helicase-related protein, partial [Fermentimonas sp.]